MLITFSKLFNSIKYGKSEPDYPILINERPLKETFKGNLKDIVEGLLRRILQRNLLWKLGKVRSEQTLLLVGVAQ